MALIDADYIADSILIEKYMGTSLSNEPSSLTRIAGVREVFQSIGQSIWNAAASLYDPNDPVRSIVNFTATGLITIFTPWWLGLIYAIASEFFGLDFATIFEKVKDYLVSLLQTKRSLSAKDVKSAVSQAIGGTASASDHVVANAENLFKKMSHLSDMYRDVMVRSAAIDKTGGALDLILSPLKLLVKKVVSPPAAKSFLGKVLSFIFKTFLIGTAKAMAGKAGRDMVGGTGPGGVTSPGGGWLSNMFSSPSSSVVSYQHKMKPQAGDEPKPGNWEENFPLANVENAIADWAVRRYPELSSHKNEMMQTNSFKEVAKAIRANNSRNHYPDQTYIPHKIMNRTVNSQGELVDLFVPEIAQKLGL